MKSARINFGLPNTEYIVRVNNDGEATSCYNQDTETEYIGGGGGGGGAGEEVTVNIVNEHTDTMYPIIYYSVETNGVVDALRIYNGKYYYDEYDVSEIAGSTSQERKYLKLSEYFYIQMPSANETVTGNAEIVWLADFEIHAAKISGDCTITILQT